MRTAINELRSKNHKNVTITAKGNGSRNILVNYAVESPVPKLTYRFLLPSPKDANTDATEHVFVQGWAIVDNPSDDDLIDIDVTIVSGLPLSFRHDLYGARYVERPEEEVPTAAGPGYAKPSEATFGTAGIRTKKYAAAMAASMAPPGFGSSLFRSTMPLQSRSTAPIPNIQQVQALGRGGIDKNMFGFGEGLMDGNVGGEEILSQLRVGPTVQEVANAAETSEVGDLFEYNIPTKVTIKAKESALVPLIMKKCDGGQVDIYSHKVRATNTLSAVRIKNTTDATFEGGPVSVYERSRLIGEGMMTSCRPASEQFLPYSVNLDCVAELIAIQCDGQVISTFAVGDYFRTTRYQEFVKKYVFQSNKTEDIDLYVLHELNSYCEQQSAELFLSRRAGGVQNNDEAHGSQVKPVDVVAGVARYHFTIRSGKKASLSVRERRQNVTSHQIRSSCTSNTILQLTSTKVIDGTTAEKMKEIMGIEVEIGGIRREITVARAKIHEISKAQERYRQNLMSLGGLQDSAKFKDDPLMRRFLNSMGESENKIEEAEREIREAELRLERETEKVSKKIAAFGSEELQPSM